MPRISGDLDACASHGLPHELTMDVVAVVVASLAGLRAGGGVAGLPHPALSRSLGGRAQASVPALA